MLLSDAVILYVLAIGIAVALVNCVLVVFVLLRRRHRQTYYELKDQARQQLASTVRSAIEGSDAGAVDRLRVYCYPAERAAIEELLLSAVRPEIHTRITGILAQLGYVERWQHVASLNDDGWLAAWKPMFKKLRSWRIFAVRRAIAVGHLGRLCSSVSVPLMKAALLDPSPLVLSVTADALAASDDEAAAPVLVDLLQRSILTRNLISERAAKTALVHLSACGEPLLKAFLASGPRVQVAILEVLRELRCRGTRLPKQMLVTVLAQAATSGSPEIRSRSAQLLRHVEHPPKGLLALLLEDPDHFVRLHAVRTRGAFRSADHTDDLMPHVHDPHWRVREAAVLALHHRGDEGKQQLIAILRNTSDRFVSEQIMEQLQWGGILAASIMRLDEHDAAVDRMLCCKAVELGMDSLLVERLHPGTPERLLERLLDVTQGSSHRDYRSRLEALAETNDGHLRTRVLGLLTTSIEDSTGAAVGAA